MHLITSHLNTDFDALASMVAVQKLYPEAVICPPGSMNRKVKDYLAHHGHQWNILKPKKVPMEQVTLMVVVDTRARSRLGPFAALVGRQEVEVHVYDHHPPTVDDIPADKMVSEVIGATTTIILERILRERKSVSAEEATLFALGIYDDTGALTYEATTQRDILAVAHLREMGADLSRILSRVEVSTSSSDRRLLDILAENVQETYINGAKVMLTWAETDEYVEGLSLLLYRLRDYCDSHVSLMAVRSGGKKTVLIARSAAGVLNVKELLEPYGGSGHVQAGSATLTGVEPQQLLKELEAELSSRIPSLLKVESVMTSPVLAVEPDASVNEAYRTMLRFGHQGLPVAHKGEVLGIMTRKDLDKAHLHGFDKARIRDFMTEGIIGIPAEAAIDEAHRLMATYGFERLPVLSKGRLVGILTRADLVRALYRTFRPVGERDAGSGFLWMEGVEALLESSFSEEVLGLLRRIGDRAQAMGMRAYIVGGAVRDILRGERNVDLDVCVEGDAEKLVREWDEPGCRGTVHGRYKTGTLSFPNGLKVDIATARREFYEYAAAEPTVSSDSMKQDLGRRDFTVNAMSISLSREDWGALTDYFGGRADLKDGVLKILHNLSFVEDPSRILRGVRLEQRMQMAFEDNTLRLMKSALKGGLLGRLSPHRVRIELEIMARERPLRRIALRMEELGAWEALFPGIRLETTPRKLRRLELFLPRARQAGVEFKNKDWLVFIATVLKDSPASVRTAAMDRLNLDSLERNILTEGFSGWPQVEQFFHSKKSPKNSEVYLLLRDHGPVPLLFWLICLRRPQWRRCVIRHALSLMKIRGELTGDDLKALGVPVGPELGKTLERIRMGIMDGEISGREDERALVESLLTGQRD
ncbi:MAG: CBS domain-containing protein [Fretibacterium sp.]|nr:CBS domain-containing protein [Fretibacterium sp.]